MNRSIILAAILLLIVGIVGWFLYYEKLNTPAPSLTSASPAAHDHAAPSHPNLAIDLYPLYPSATWNTSTAEVVTIGTTTYTGAGMTSTPLSAGMDPEKTFTPFTQYYDQLLKSHGWHVVNDLAADGHTGGQMGYQNGPGTALVRFTIDYQTNPPNAPSECPCTVTFSLFSSGATD